MLQIENVLYNNRPSPSSITAAPVAQYKCLMEFLSGETPDTQGQGVQACALAKGGVSD
jgi:hypothetical protein